MELETANWMISSLIITGKLEDAYTTIRQMASLATQDNHDLEYLKKWATLWAICSWSLFGEFHNDLLTYVPDELRFGLQYIQKCHQQQKVDPVEAEVDPLTLHSSFISDLIEQSVKLHQPALSEALVNLFPTFRSELAAALYKEGNRNEAGEHFIRLVSDQAADAKVLFI